MKKLCIYIILFLSIFVGITSAIVYNGYTNYEKELQNQQTAVVDNSALTNLTSGILNTENYSGKIELTSTNEKNNLSGTFNLTNSQSLTAQIILAGSINKFDINANLTLENNELFIDINNIKLMCSTTDLLELFNQLTTIIEQGSKSDFSALDISALQGALSNIKLSETAGGYCLNLPIPNVCNIFISTTTEYVPTQILLTNLKVGEEIYTLNIKTSSNPSPFLVIDKTEYLNIASSFNYIAPIVNTLTQGSIRLSGKIIFNSTPLNLNLYLTKDLLLLGDISYNGLTAQFEFDGTYIVVKLYDNYFKLTPTELITLLKNTFGLETPSKLSISDINLPSLINDINTTVHINNKNLIDACYINYNNYSIDLQIGKTFYLPERINSSTYNSAADIQNFITYYKNAISSEYSIDIAANYNNITINGKAYLNLADKFSGINKVLFDGTINNIPVTVNYLEKETYIKITDNHIKVENASWSKIISSISNLLDLNEADLSTLLSINDINITKIKLNNKSLELTNGFNYIKLTSYITNYVLNLQYNNLNLNAKIYPSSTEYLYIERNLNSSIYNNFSEAASLITALDNTLSLNNLHYAGCLTINVLDFAYKNILVDIRGDINNNYLQITLDNLPIDAAITHLNDLYFLNQKCVLTIQNGLINIQTTVTSRFLNIKTCIVNKTIPLSELSIYNLYDIFSMKKSIIDKFNKNTSSNILTNLSTDTIKLLKNKLLFNYTTTLNTFIMNINAEFNYLNYILDFTANVNIGDILFIKLSLTKK